MSDRNLIVSAPGKLEIVEEEIAPGPFRVRTLFSGVSAGTELSFVKNTNPALHHGFDTELGLFGGPADNAYPVTRLGYMEVGVVTSSETPAVATGTTVAMTYGHRTGWTGDPLRDRIVPLPDDLDPILGIYAAHMGPICANGLLHAAGSAARDLGDGVAGRRVAVTGAGVVGLLTALFARAHGAASVVVLDPSPERRAIAEALGLDTLDTDGPDDPAVVLKTAWRHWAGDRGADVVFQCRGQASALQLALRLLRPQGTVIDLAFYQGGADAVRLGEEFHHNGLSLVCAQIGRVPRGLAGTWDRERLSAATVDLLRRDGDAIRRHLITAVVPFDDAPTLLDDLAARRRQEVQSVLSF
ncbi:NADPH:quinone reductase-like Zn-dependent oxidoreductase [Catenuloplanes nepalensis]|uniref:NADPH:quinone reductase-like Zn-dependent oxidoreductase n=1 Tax=Catenuloplanes nepalensis TaxID=587533 RepID=A0ABT9MNC7_9ACTN|nr:zinc-binding alcohol dehydrogenase [Catenuloplanes nepalensis]MDP9792841.1 NADPH:quinone reductase-like Zn-dependent oxidoreductase [Catenuloplanes nepalensis]